MEVRQVYWHNDAHSAMGNDAFLYCPMCGTPLTLETIDHRLRKVCPGCGFVHFRNPAPTVSLLIVSEDQVLLGTRPGSTGRKCWSTPSGYIEMDEDFLTTAIREAKEETGLDVRILSILNVTDSFFPPEQHYLNIYLQAQVIGGQLMAGDDMGELRWFPLSGPFPDMAFQEDIDMIDCFRRAASPCFPVDEAYSQKKLG